MYQGLLALCEIGGTEIQARQYAESYSKQLEPAKGKDSGAIPTHKLIPEQELKVTTVGLICIIRFIHHLNFSWNSPDRNCEKALSVSN